jgi:hypothetical protein
VGVVSSFFEVLCGPMSGSLLTRRIKNEASVVVCRVICVCSKINRVRVIKLLLQSSMSQKYRYHYYHSHRYYY